MTTCTHDTYLDINGPIPTFGTPALWRCYDCPTVWVYFHRHEDEPPQRKHLKVGK